ncbi:hypothetical protein [Vibrio sp. CAU 1672]|nr:hypothetical protein [Vibrio sp. CAU 1672]MDF2153511.1 hypothetical protein [Vibrio sp. CAU 1672]
MKHFLPSSVMLTPFVVRYYEEDTESEAVEPKSTVHSPATEETEATD